MKVSDEQSMNSIKSQKIFDIAELAEQLSIHFTKWIFLGKRIKVINYYENKNFNKKISLFLRSVAITFPTDNELLYQ